MNFYIEFVFIFLPFCRLAFKFSAIIAGRDLPRLLD